MIAPMKKARIIVLKRDQKALLAALQKTGEFMVITEGQNEHAAPGGSQAGTEAQESEAMLRFLSRFGKKESLLAPKPEVSSEAFDRISEEGLATRQSLSAYYQQIGDLGSRVTVLENQNEALIPWMPLELPLEELKDTEHVRFLTGFIPDNEMDDLRGIIQDVSCDLTVLAMGAEGRAVLLILYKAGEGELIQQIKEIGFTEATPPRAEGVPQAICEANLAEIGRLNEEKTAIEEAVAGLVGHKQDLELLTEQYLAQNERDNVPYAETAETICLYGWICADREDVIHRAIEETTEVYDFHCEDPQEGEIPPTVTRNSHFLSQFEAITAMFALPLPGDIDPAPIAGPWFWIIFGMMMGDVGYGAIMLVLFYLYRKVKKPKGQSLQIINILLYSSFPTIIFGVLFGSYFGETWNPIFLAPMDNPMGMLIFTLVVGMLHIFSGMGIAMAQDIKNGHVLDAIFDQLSWMVLLTGLGFLFLPALAAAGKWMAIAGAVVILCTAGRSEKSIFGKIKGGVLGLYGISSYFSDILSYSRIMALSLATGVIGMVMNLLAHMISGSIIGFIFALLIYLVGHAFNLVMSLLSAYVHDSRLQYIEFFNKFYEGGGIVFRPLSVKSKFIDVVDSENLNNH